MRATGSSFLSLVAMGVLPQVMPRFIGFSAYQLDSNLRNSALVGLVGGGGIGVDAVHRVPALRLRLRAHHRAGDHRRGHGGRDRVGMDAKAVPMSAGAAATNRRRFAVGSGSRPPSASCARPSIWSILIAVIWSLQTIEMIPEFLYDAPQQTADLFVRMWPIDWAWYPKVVHAALIETLHTATLGTILAVAMASLVALMVARNITQSLDPQHHRALHPGRDALGACDDLGAVLRRGVRARRAGGHAGHRRPFDRLHRKVPVGGDRGGEARPDRSPGRDRRARRLRFCSRAIGRR